MRTEIAGLALLGSLLGTALPAQAGWVITENGEQSFLSEGKVRSGGEDGMSILDAAAGKLIFVDSSRKVYVESTVEEYCKTISDIQKRALESVPPEQRKMMEEMLGGANQGPAPKVSVVEEGSGGKIAGMDTVKHKVLVDGALYEEVWLATDPELKKDYAPLTKMVGKFEACVAAPVAKKTAHTSPQYAELLARGLIVKTVSHGPEGASSEVKSIQKQDIPSSKFEVPVGHRKVTLAELFTQQAVEDGERDFEDE